MLTIPFENDNANRSVQNGTEWNKTNWSRLHYTMHGTVLERSKRLFLASGNGVSDWHLEEWIRVIINHYKFKKLALTSSVIGLQGLQGLHLVL